jgi:ribonuclease-3
MKVNEIYSKIGYKFKDEALLKNALTHPSMISEQVSKKIKVQSYERLEFLGDSVLGLVISEMLMENYRNESEGDLSRRKTFLVCGKTLAEIAEMLEISKFIMMSKGEEVHGGRKNMRNLENIMEAIIGAMYIDGGLEPVRKFVEKNWIDRILEQKDPPKELKTELQELSQKYYNCIPRYVLVEKSGAEHSPKFRVSVEVDGLESFVGEGLSKKEAEKDAAEKMVEYIEEILKK